MCTPQTAEQDEAPHQPVSVPSPTSPPAPGPLLLLGRHVRIMQSGFGSLSDWLGLLQALGDGCCRLLLPAVRRPARV